MKKIINTVILLSVLLAFSCEKFDTEIVLTIDDVKGVAQKGPYLNGTTISVYELSEELKQTGRSFGTEIEDNLGTFELQNLGLSYPFVEFVANGYYFDEVSNKKSESQLALSCITDLSEDSQPNINVLTTIEKARVEYLVKKGADFRPAKQQAQAEILQIFEIDPTGLVNSEYLHLANSGDGNAILLAVSSILQGYLSVAEVSELMADIATDIRRDGELNSKSLGEKLISNARALRANDINEHLKQRYNSLGADSEIPDFQKHLLAFIENTNFIATNVIEYPIMHNSVLNLLADSSFVVTGGVEYPLAVYLPKGMSIKIVCKPSEGSDWAAFGIGMFGDYEMQNHYPDSTVLFAEGKDEIENRITAFGAGGITGDEFPTSIDFIIYENGATSPTHIKTVKNYGD